MDSFVAALISNVENVFKSFMSPLLIFETISLSCSILELFLLLARTIEQCFNRESNLISESDEKQDDWLSPAKLENFCSLQKNLTFKVKKIFSRKHFI